MEEDERRRQEARTSEEGERKSEREREYTG